MSDWAEMQLRIHGSDGPTLIYLPGLHGDWTLVGSFRTALGQRVRFAELTYPRTLTWSAEQHAAAIIDCLRERGISEGWILAESFGSVLGWTILESAPQASFRVQGIILAGGFVRYPIMPLVALVQGVNRLIPMFLLRALGFVYARYATFRHRHAPETLEDIAEFLRRRSEPADRQAICYRYQLIRQSDARGVARNANVPVYQLCGFIDPIVPWLLVQRWLKMNCPNFKACRMNWGADHNVLGTAPQAAAEQVLRWITAK